MKKRVGIYVRVSTKDQTVQQQIDLLQAWAQAKGHQVVEVFNETVSGAAKNRPELDRLMANATKGKLDLVAAVALDRLGRSLVDVVGLLNELKDLGVDLYLDRESIDSSTAAGKALLGMAAVFAEFERSILIERVNAGISRAQQHGTKSGKPFGRPTVDPKQVAHVRRLRADGVKVAEILKRRDVQLSRAAIYRALK